MDSHINPLRLLIIDDFPAIIDRVSRLLNPLSLFEVVGSLKSADHVEKSISQFHPHVVIMDLHVGQGSTVLQGVDVIGRIKRARPDLKVVVFTFFSDERYRERSLAQGADFFLDKVSESERLPEILSVIYRELSSRNN